MALVTFSCLRRAHEQKQIWVKFQKVLGEHWRHRVYLAFQMSYWERLTAARVCVCLSCSYVSHHIASFAERLLWPIKYCSRTSLCMCVCVCWMQLGLVTLAVCLPWPSAFWPRKHTPPQQHPLKNVITILSNVVRNSCDRSDGSCSWFRSTDFYLMS